MKMFIAVISFWLHFWESAFFQKVENLLLQLTMVETEENDCHVELELSRRAELGQINWVKRMWDRCIKTRQDMHATFFGANMETILPEMLDKAA